MLKILNLPKVEYITSTEGKPKAVVLSLEDWKRITETLKIMSSKELMQSIRRAKKQLRSNARLLSLEKVLENL
jgi:PHD/YefM family antitoxin component YafN of YafNO toxin-antitoxin module